ncbi:MAG TPA: response regulator transcription factor [Rubrobacter sp.]|nr:response regulator transcription factor [Rubrobacter sp.]
MERLATRVRVMLVEDQADFRHLMATLLGRQPDLEVAAEAKSLAEARVHVETARFDVVVLDLGLPDGTGTDLIADLRNANPDTSVLILSASLTPDGLARASEAGADEIMDKFAALDEVVDTIRRLGSC